MAVVATTTYLYVDISLNPYYVQGAGLIDRGPWSSSAFYNPPDVIQIGIDYYIALAPNSNTPPTGIVDENWSTLVVVEESGSNVVNAGSDYYARTLAELALETAWVGTAIGSAAYNYAEAAYNLAIIGTNNAGAFAVGTDAYHLAESGTSIAWSAYYLAQIGTNTGTAALNAAASAQSTANGAFSIAVDGTNAAAAAQSTATSGSNLAYQAYLLAASGTVAGIDLTARAVAEQAYALAELGTVIPPLSTLPDVSIPAPTASQILTFDGSLWIAGDAPSTISPSAFTYYTDNTASGTLSLYNLTTSPSGQPEHQASLSVGATTPFVAGRSFIAPQLNRTLINAGAWQFNTFASNSTAQRPYVIITDVAVRTIAGVQTYLFSGTTAAITSLAVQPQVAFVTHGSVACSVTDRLVFSYFAYRSGAVTTATVYSAGTDHDSSIITPIGYAHNDLEGLQGGATGQYYHVTLDQNGALVGTGGTPSGTNPYVTLVTHVIEQGTRAQEDQYLQNQITVLQQQLGADFSGTISMFTSLVRYGKPDTAWTVIDGVVSNQVESKFIWDDFDSYGTTTGTQPVTGLDDGSSWNGNGSIYTNNLWVGLNGTDWMNLYPTGTISSDTLNNGTGWATTGTSYEYCYFFRFLGTDTFESYGTGTLSSSGTEVNAGGGWVGTAQCYTGSNRP